MVFDSSEGEKRIKQCKRGVGGLLSLKKAEEVLCQPWDREALWPGQAQR